MSVEENISNKTDCDEYEKNIKILLEKVDNLYRVRDHYFEDNSIDRAEYKNADISTALEATLKLFEELKDSVGHDRAKFYYLKGKALNVVPEYKSEAEELLSKAIKLGYKTFDTWNILGEVYWKVNKLSEAKNCFNTALNQERNKKSLRNLSMLTRQMGFSNREEQKTNIELGVQYAKEAVQLDPQDGISWAILGNAHLYYYFLVSQNPAILKQCISAYCQAEKDTVAKHSSDLHYNKGITLKYEEKYKLALDSFTQATILDPAWDAPKTQEQELIKYLDNVVELVNTTGKLKGKKRLYQIVKSIDSRQLGPYKGGVYTASNKQTVKLVETFLTDLKPGVNLEKVVLGKVVCSVHSNDSVPFTFCLVDKKGVCLPVMVYNLAEGKGVIIGDSVAIPEPYVANVDFTYKGKEYKFQSIRVETPLVLVINGKKAGLKQQANIQLSITNRFD